MNDDNEQVAAALLMQQIFDRVANHLLIQNKRSLEEANTTDDFGQCAYRSYDGLKCAIGCLIADEDYTERMEGKTVYSLLQIFRHLLSITALDIEDPCLDMLEGLQHIHDQCPVADWPTLLESTAIRFSLTIPASLAARLDK